MATATVWTSRSLSEMVWALRRLVQLASRVQLPSASQQYWDQVQHWLSDAEPLLRQAAAGGSLAAEVPAFPLTSPQLRVLQADVYQIVRRRLAGQRGLSARRRREMYRHLLTPVESSLELLHTTLHNVDRSAYALILALALLFLVNVLTLFVFTRATRQTILLVNLVALLLIGVVWVIHYWLLRQHQHSLHLHSAIRGI